MTEDYKKFTEKRRNQEHPKCYYCGKEIDKSYKFNVFNGDHWECFDCSMKYSTGEYSSASSSDHM